MKDCPLCIREPIKPLIYENDRFWVTWCSTHPECPLIVLKEHRSEFTLEEKKWIEKFVSAKWPTATVRWTKKSFPEHSHCHVEV